MKQVKCIFSDDIRREEGGKHSIIGIYGDTLQINGNVTVLPKLCITIYLTTDELDTKSITFDVKINGNVVDTLTISEDSLKAARENPNVKTVRGAFNKSLLFVNFPEPVNAVDVDTRFNGEVVYTERLIILTNNKPAAAAPAADAPAAPETPVQ